MDTPFCITCATHHEPEEPHAQSAAFAAHVRRTQGREANAYDAIAHTHGLVFHASAAALLSQREVDLG